MDTQITIAVLNMWDLNAKPLTAISYMMRDLDADIVFLQETPKIVWPTVENNKTYRFFHAKDQKSRGKLSRLYILVKKDRGFDVVGLHAHRVVSHSAMPSRHFMYCIRACVARFVGSAPPPPSRMCIQSHSVCLKVGSRIFHAINCHLEAHCSIERRSAQFDAVMKAHIGNGSVVLCGDLNTHGAWWRNMLAGWLFGIRVRELFVNEIARLDRIAVSRGLHRVFRGFRDWRLFPWFFHVTHPWTLSNIDHILVSKDTFEVIDRRILPSKHMSDHRGLYAVLKVH